MKIGKIDLSRDVLIVAEIGNNHEGRFDVAQELVYRATECGVHAVKFQTFKTEHYISASDVARFNRLKSFELNEVQFADLAQLARSLGLIFISTPFDLQSAKLLEPLVDSYKIASGDNNFYPLIAQAAHTTKPIIISSGMCDEAHLHKVIKFVGEQRYGNELDIAILHCVTSYPVPDAQVNLKSIPVLQDRLGVPIGYSDHTLGLDAATAAVALGARIIEKHFTLDRNFSDFRDHQLSADPNGMSELVRRIKTTTAMLGEYAKTVQRCEESLIPVVRRSIVAGANLFQGHLLEMKDLTWLRPAGGLAPGEESRLLGKTLKRDLTFGERLSEADVE